LNECGKNWLTASNTLAEIHLFQKFYLLTKKFQDQILSSFYATCLFLSVPYF